MRSNEKQVVTLVALALAILAIVLIPLYFRISGDLSVCRQYYPEMGRMECYFSSKTVHRDVYESIEQYLSGPCSKPDWQDDESYQRAIATDELWEMSWHPNNPVGGFSVAAPTLDELLAFALEYEAGP